MATFSTTTTAAQDAAAQRQVNIINATSPAGTPPITALTWVRSLIFNRLDALIAQFRDEDNVSKADLYRRATTDDQTTIDAILDKYR